MVDKIRIYGDPVLRKTAKPVTEFIDELKLLINSMKKVMYENKGVGLAAPQMGHSVRLALIDTSDGEEEPYILINPDIFFFSDEKEGYDEGCLSIPGITLNVKRPSKISVHAIDKNGHEYTLKNIDGLLARAIQHEIDHLDGILFVDRISPVQRRLISGKLKKLAKSSRGK